MNYRFLQILTVILPTILIGGFEFIRHDVLYPYMSMETGNLYMTLLIFVISLGFSAWVFRTIKRINEKLSAEQARRAVYEERERLARELHDGIAQTLFFLNVKLKQGSIEEASHAVSAIDNQVRQAIFNLRSLPEEGGSFTQRVEKWISKWSLFTEIDLLQEINCTHDLLSKTEEVRLFGVIQETFNNIRKHSSAKLVQFHLQGSKKDGWKLVIEDDGIGIEAADLAGEKYGLTMIRESARHLGAHFTIRKRKSTGTEVVLSTIRRGLQA